MVQVRIQAILKVVKEKIELALVGRSRWGDNYKNTVKNIDSCNLSLENIKGKDYEALFSEALAIDGVIIASSTDSHTEVAKAFLERGISVLVEKPMTRTVEEAESLRELSKGACVFMVGHTLLYAPEIRVMQENLNLIGSLKKIVFEGLQSPPRADSTVLQNWGPHPMYLAEFFMGRHPTRVEAVHLNNDNILLVLDFDNNQICEAKIGCISAEKKRRLEIHGEKGKLVLDWSTPVKTLTLERGRTKTSLDFPSSTLPLEAVVLGFLECIQTGKRPLADFEQGFRVVQIIEKAEESLKTGLPVNLPWSYS